MKGKGKAERLGRTHSAIKTMVVHDHVLIIRGQKTVVKIDFERWFYIAGGVVFGLGIMALSIMIPILLGGY